MSLRKLHLIAGALLAAALVIAAFAMSAAAAAPLKITNCITASSRPKSLTLACGDGDTALTGMRWSSFGGSTAVGKGTFVTNTCEPNCAAGKDLRFPVTVRATGSRACKGGLKVYGKLTLTFGSAKKPKSDVPRSWTFLCPT